MSKKAKTPELPKYMPAVLAAIAQVNAGPGVRHVTVYHDDSCALLKRRGPCNCTPEVRLGGPT